MDPLNAKKPETFHEYELPKNAGVGSLDQLGPAEMRSRHVLGSKDRLTAKQKATGRQILAEIRRARDRGVPPGEIAADLGIPESVVVEYLDSL